MSPGPLGDPGSFEESLLRRTPKAARVRPGGEGEQNTSARHTPVVFIAGTNRYGREVPIGRQCQHCGMLMNMKGNPSRRPLRGAR